MWELKHLFVFHLMLKIWRVAFLIWRGKRQEQRFPWVIWVTQGYFFPQKPLIEKELGRLWWSIEFDSKHATSSTGPVRNLMLLFEGYPERLTSRLIKNEKIYQHSGQNLKEGPGMEGLVSHVLLGKARKSYLILWGAAFWTQCVFLGSV